MRRLALPYLLPAALLVSLLPGGSPVLTAATADAALAGTVTGPSGEPLSDVCVRLERGTSGDLAATTTTASDGSWSVGGLSGGSYLVGVNTCPEARAGVSAQWWPGVIDATAAAFVDIAPSTTRGDVDVSLTEAGAVAGVVTDQATGDPIPGICVGAMDFATGAQGMATTDANGAYRVASLPAGSYMVTFDDCTAPRTHMGEAYPDVPATADPATALDRVQLVDVTVGQDVEGIAGALGRAGAAAGVVIAEHTGRPVRGVCVGAHADGSEARPATAQTGGAQSFDVPSDAATTAGEYELTYLPSGAYRVAVADPACADDGYVPAWVGGEDRASATQLVVKEGQVSRLPDVTVSASPSLLLACGFPDQDEESGFSDVRGDNVHAAAIACAARRGLANGTSADTYNPAGTVRRDQMASFTARLVRAAGVVLPPAPSDAFTDDNGNTHELAINQLAELGVVGGTGGGMFSPDARVRRNQMATFLVNAYEEVAGFTLQASADRFDDDQGDRHESSINKAATAAFTAGLTATQYGPTAEVSREQMASFLMRTLDRLIRDVRPDLAAMSSREGTTTSSSLDGADVTLQHHAGSTVRWGRHLFKVLLHVKRPTAYSHYWFAWHCGPPKYFTIAPIGNWMSWYWCLRAAGGVGY